MKEIKRLIATSILLIALSGLVMADGGITQGPGAPAPPPACTEGCPDVPSTAPLQDSSLDISAVAGVLFAVLVEVAY